MATSKIVNEAPKLNGAYEDPDRLLIVGLDTFPPGIDPNDYEQFSDPRRIAMPIKEGLILSIMANGVNDPITCISARASSGDRYRIVVNGRQRVRATREANKRMRKAGGSELISVPYITKQNADSITVVISNEYHTKQSPLDKAEKAKRLIDWGKSKSQIRASFESDDGTVISPATLDNYLSLLKLSEKDKARLEAGTLGLTEAYALVRNGKPAKGRAAPEEDGESDGPEPATAGHGPKAPPRKVIAELATTYAPSEHEPHEEGGTEALVYALATWVATGDADLLDAWPEVAEQIAKLTRPSVKAPRAKANGYHLAKEEM